MNRRTALATCLGGLAAVLLPTTPAAEEALMPWPFVPPDPDAPAPLAADYSDYMVWREKLMAWAGWPSYAPKTAERGEAWKAQHAMESQGVAVGVLADLMRDLSGS